MKEFLVEERQHDAGNGVHKLYKFPNGYGASVVRFMAGPFGGSYGAAAGLWELAVIEWGEDGGKDDYAITYSTPLTDDVIGYLADDDVQELLTKIKNLEK